MPYPLIILKFIAAMGIFSLLNLIYYLWLERDFKLIFGIVYSYYACFMLQWIYP